MKPSDTGVHRCIISMASSYRNQLPASSLRGGVVMVCGQRVALGRTHQWRALTIHVAETTLAIELDDGETRTVRRTTTLPLLNIKTGRPRTVPSAS